MSETNVAAMDQDDFALYKKTNREKRISPKRGLFWCWKCDRQIVGVGEKCTSCGAKPLKKTLKKESNVPK